MELIVLYCEERKAFYLEVIQKGTARLRGKYRPWKPIKKYESEKTVATKKKGKQKN